METTLDKTKTNAKISVLIPVYNEEITIKKVIKDFQRELPDAFIYVYDNNSTDNSAEIAVETGAILRRENRQGKGFVIESMFREIESDIYIMVDGDDTYPAKYAMDMIAPIISGEADMVVGTRLTDYKKNSFRSLHVIGNRFIVKAVNSIFRSNLRDIMSGYRAFNKRFIKEMPIMAKGFEVETEMTIQALYRGFVIKEIPIPYGERPENSESKLNTFKDGFKIIIKILDIFKAYRPLLFFGILSLSIALLGLGLGGIPIVRFIQTGKVENFPTAILASGLMIIAFLSATCGLIMDGVNYRVKEISQLIIKAMCDNGKH